MCQKGPAGVADSADLDQTASDFNLLFLLSHFCSIT